MGRYFPDLSARNAAQMGQVDANPVQLVAEEIASRWDIAFLWGRSSGSSGEHPKGLALDFSVLAYGGGVNNPGPANKAEGDAIAAYLWANRARMGVWYIIWNRRIISTNRSSYAFGRWVAYNGRSPHTDHVHVSFYAANIYQPPTTPQPEPLPEDDVQLSDQMPVPQWLRDMFPDDKGLADGQMTVQTALASGYAHSRTVRSELADLRRYVVDHHADILANVQQNETAIQQLAQQVAELLARLDPGDTPEEPRGEVQYKVAKGDTMTAIAERYDVTAQAIAERNGISNPDRIFVGQVLIIPAPEGSDES